MPGENAESRARKAIDAQDPKQGQEMQQVQALQSSIQEIQGERTNNLMTARMGAEGDARENQAMLQAAELGMLGAAGGAMAVENATPVQQTSPQTQAILSKYGVGKPRNQTTTTRSVQQTPTKITINNNTTNNTTNNVAVPAANIGGPVQGRTLAIKQQPDPGQARFKTWISNAFARQNQAAAQREKEYQRREWSLSRTTGKLMKKLQELGTTISERMDPRKMASSVGGHLKTLLFLFGTMFLARNWEKVLEIGHNIENFFVGGGKNNPNKKSGFQNLLVKMFGGVEGETPGKAFKDFWWNPKGVGGVGVFDLLLQRIKDFFEVRGIALNSIKQPEWASVNNNAFDGLGGFLKDSIRYLGSILKIMVAGPKAAKDHVQESVRIHSTQDSVNTKDGRGNTSTISTTNNESGKPVVGPNGYRVQFGTVSSVIGDRNYIIPYEDYDSDGNLKKDIGSVNAEAGNIIRFKEIAKKGKVGVAPVASGYNRLSKAAKDYNGIPLRSSYVFKELGGEEGNAREKIQKFINSGDITGVNYRIVIRPRTTEEINSGTMSPIMAGGIQLAEDNLMDSVGSSSTAEKAVKDALSGQITERNGLERLAARIAAWFTDKVVPGDFEDELTAFYRGLNEKGKRNFRKQHYIFDLIPSEEVEKNGLPNGWLLPDDKELRDIRFDLLRVTPKVIDAMVQNFTNNNKLTADSNSVEYFSAIQKSLEDIAKNNGISELEYIGNHDYISEYKRLEDLEKRKKEIEDRFYELYNESRVKRARDNAIDTVNKVKDHFSPNNNDNGSGKISRIHQAAFIKQMREAYSKKFEELGLDKKYIDALVAQDAYESTWGTSDLVKQNNYGGIRNGNKGWQSFNSLDDYIDYKVNLLNDPSGRYNAFSSGEDIGSMINRVSEIYAPASDGNKDYSGTWATMYNQVQKFKPLSTEEIKALRNQGRWAEADMASASWEKIEDVLRKGGVTGFKVTSDNREPGEEGNAGNKSYHTTDNLAIDIVPVGDQTFEGLKQQMLNSPIVQKYFADRNLGVLDETSAEMLKKTGGTGPHFHIGPDNSSIQGWLAWNKENNINPYSIKQISDENYPLDDNDFTIDWNKFANPSALAMATADLPKVTPDTSTPVNSGNSNPITVSSTEKTARDITTNNDTDLIAGDISQKITQIVENLKVVHSGQLAQIEAINNLANSIAGIKINVGQGGNGPLQPTVQSWSAPCYSESNG